MTHTVTVPLNSFGDSRKVTLRDGEVLCDECRGKGSLDPTIWARWTDGGMMIYLPRECDVCGGSGKVEVLE